MFRRFIFAQIRANLHEDETGGLGLNITGRNRKTRKVRTKKNTEIRWEELSALHDRGRPAR